MQTLRSGKTQAVSRAAARSALSLRDIGSVLFFFLAIGFSAAVVFGIIGG